MKINRIIACLASGLLIAGCSDYDAQNETGSKTPISIRGDVQQEYVTRANDGGFADGDQIGVFIANREGDQPAVLKATGNHADNVAFTYSDETGQWTGSYNLYWKDNTTSVDAYSYYPFSKSITSVDAMPFAIHQKQQVASDTKSITGYEASDFLWAKADNVAPGTVINLGHRHIMAGVEVKLVEGEGFQNGELASLENVVLVENTSLNTTINLTTGEVTLVDNTISTIVPQQNGTTWRAIVAPQTVAADKTLLTITVDGVSYLYTRASAMTFLPGKLHKFTIKVDRRQPSGDYEFSLISEAITPWENDSESHNGSAREYIVINVEEGQYLGDVIKNLRLDPEKIINLKLTGCIGDFVGGYYSESEPWYANGDGSFRYIRENMVNLEALNMKELRTKNMPLCFYGSDPGYGMPKAADDYIPAGAFENMSTLRYFTWPDHLKGIGDQSFAGSGICGSLIFPEGMVYIGSNAFSAYGHAAKNGLNGELYIPSTVEYIGGNAFGQNDGNVNMFFFSNELILPSRMKYLGTGAFSGCPHMTGTIRVPDGLTELNNAWPKQIGGPLVIPQGIKKINGIPLGATNVSIPEGVEEISGRAFAETENLKCQVHLPSTVKKIGEAAFYSEWNSVGITSINLPEGLEIVEGSAFHRCSNLQGIIEIPSTVTQIREDAFKYCSQLEGVILPAGLLGIKSGAFSNCYSLNYIECLGSEPPAIEENTFSGVEKDNFTVVVPVGAVEAYKSAPYWREFKRISAYRNFVCRPMQAKLLNKSNVRDVILNANDTWSISDCPSWIHVSPSSGNKKTELKITIDEMAHGQGNREGAVTFLLGRNDEDGNPVTCTYTVKQFDYEYDEDGVIPLKTASKGQRGGIDVLFVGEGYDAEDISDGTYLNDMKQEMEYFFGVEPYRTYKDYFKVSAAVALSYESGVVDSPDKWRNTKFSITWGAGNNGRLDVPFEAIGSYVLNDVANSPVTTANVSRSLIICVPNSDAYEGLTSIYSDGSAIAVCPMSKLAYPNDARGIIQHEAGGHGWAKLDDEYVYHRNYIQTCNCICCTHADAVEGMHAIGWGRNVSLNGRYGQVEWKHLIAHEKYSDIVDIYEGGHMHAQGIFRSEVNSCMNNNVPYFSTWSRQLIVERIMDASGETFSFESFVANDSRDYGDKFLTRGQTDIPWQQVNAYHSEHHGPIIHKGSVTDYLKKKGGKR